MNRLFRIACALLLLIIPGALLAQTNHNFAKWEREIAAYEASDHTNPPPQGALLFIGSSTIGRWKSLAKDFPEQKVINRGFGGSEIVDSTHFADRLIYPHHPKAVFLRAGGNDLWAGKSVDRVVADFKEFAATVRSNLPNAEIVFISLSPSIARWTQAQKEKAVNDQVADFIKKTPGLSFIDTYDIVLDKEGKPRPELFVADKLHFNAEGYKLLADRLRPHLK